MSGIIVSKFGGTSLSDGEHIKQMADIILSDPSRRYVVVSAPGLRENDNIRVTDMFYICHSRYANRENFNEMIEKIESRFTDIVNELGIDFNIHAEITDLKKNLFLGRSNDYIVSRGEYIMGRIMAEYLGWDFVDAAEIIFFNRDGSVNREKTYPAIKEILGIHEHAVVPGFYGTLSGNNIKTFERGGADATGALIARSLEAEFIEKWTQSTEIFSADPSIVENPELIRNITYAELKELTYMGIDVVYDRVIAMLEGSKVKMKILSIDNPDDPGTMITPELMPDAKRDVAACIAGRRNYKVVHIHKFGLNRTVGIGQKMFGIFSKYNISCEHYMSGIYQFSIVVKNPMFDLRRADIIKNIKEAIDPENVEVEKDLSLIAVIGQGMGTVKGIFARMFNALAAADIKVRMIEQGADDLNIIIGVYDEDFETSIKALYDALILK